MNHEAGGDEMALRRRDPPSSAPPLEDENILGEILLRVAPLPSSLLRASLVSKLWERLATAPAFHRRFVAHNRRPPHLGVFGQQGRELVFTSLLDAPDRIPRERFSLRPGGHGDEVDFWALLGCRHERVLFISTFSRALLVFDPVSGDRRRVAIPLDFDLYVPGGAVLCAAGDDQGHVHGDCHSSPFKVVLVGTRMNHPALAQVYSSETGMWGDLLSTTKPCDGLIDSFPCTLVGNVLYWWLYGHNCGILEFDMHSQTLAVTEGPSSVDIDCINSRIIRGEDGGVGVAIFSYLTLKMWNRKVSSQGVYTWELRKIVIVHKIIDLTHPIETRNEPIVGYSEDPPALFIKMPCCSGQIKTGKEAIVGYSEDAHALFIKVSCCSEPHTFIVQLESMQSRKLNQSFLENSYHPFTDFFTAGTVRP